MPIKSVCVFTILCALQSLALAQTSAASSSISSAEEPQDRAVREGMARIERLRHNGADEERWSSVWLYSESTNPSELSMTVIKVAGTQMALDPNKGDITFTGKQATHRFHLTSVRGDPKSACPDYTVRIVEASATYALVRHTCNTFEYRRNKFMSSVDYFLYDLETGSMRSIWANTVTGKGAPLPYADPAPVLKVTPDGYKFNWKPRPENKGDQFERHISSTPDTCRTITTPDKKSDMNSICQCCKLSIIASVVFEGQCYIHL